MIKARKKWFWFELICIIALSVFVILKAPISIDKVSKSDHINLITANSIFAGFLFTGLGILISIIRIPRIKRLNDSAYLDNFFYRVYSGMAFHIISLILSLAYVILNESDLLPVLTRASIISMIAGVYFFLRSVMMLIHIAQMARFD